MSTLSTDFFAKINQISPLEHVFTEVLSTIVLTPKTLYFRGKLPQNVSKNDNLSRSRNGNPSRPRTVAIVGSRHSTKYGEEVAYRLAYELARNSVVVVSGLAYGIDTTAHRGCLDAGGVTVAVLGTPIDRIYPRPHYPIARQIVQQGGAIISEYAPTDAQYNDTPLAPGEYFNRSGQRALDHKAAFLYRNRLISSLSDIVVVVEAAERSGSLNTATHAIEQGKTVFAVPGNITSPYSVGCNKLIRQGAIPYAEPDDVLRELFPGDFQTKHRRLRQQNLIGDTDVETKILRAIAKGFRSGEAIMTHTLLPPEVFSETITLLEIKDRVRSLGLNRWNLA